MSNVVSLEMKGDIALVKIDNPPVNATGIAVRIGLLDAVAAAEEANAKAAIVFFARAARLLLVVIFLNLANRRKNHTCPTSIRQSKTAQSPPGSRRPTEPRLAADLNWQWRAISA